MSPTTMVQMFDFLEAAATGPAARITVGGLDVFGETGADDGPGMWDAVAAFCRRRPGWTVVAVGADGVITLSRDPADKAPLPGKVRMAWRYLGVKLGEFWYGRRLVPPDVAAARLDVCAVCVYRNDTQCALCGCYLDAVPDDSPVDAGAPGKAHRADEECPASRWHRWELPTIASPSSTGESGTA